MKEYLITNPETIDKIDFIQKSNLSHDREYSGTVNDVIDKAISRAYNRRVSHDTRSPTALRNMCWESQKGCCFYCGKFLPLNIKGLVTLDHKTPLFRGGNNTDDNLCVACDRCNNLKGNMTEKEFRKEWIT